MVPTSQVLWKNMKTWRFWHGASLLSQDGCGGVGAGAAPPPAAPTPLCQDALPWKHHSSPGDGHFRAAFLNCLKLKEHPTLLKKTYRSPWEVSPQLLPSASQGQSALCSLPASAPCSAFSTPQSTWERVVTPNSGPGHFSTSHGSPVAQGPQGNKSRLQYWKNYVCPHLYLMKSQP